MEADSPLAKQRVVRKDIQWLNRVSKTPLVWAIAFTSLVEDVFFSQLRKWCVTRLLPGASTQPRSRNKSRLAA